MRETITIVLAEWKLFIAFVAILIVAFGVTMAAYFAYVNVRLNTRSMLLQERQVAIWDSIIPAAEARAAALRRRTTMRDSVRIDSLEQELLRRR